MGRKVAVKCFRYLELRVDNFWSTKTSGGYMSLDCTYRDRNFSSPVNSRGPHLCGAATPYL